MRPHLRRSLPVAAFLLCAALATALATGAQAQFTLFRGSSGRGLTAADNQLLFASIAKLNAAEPAEVGRSTSWSNPQTRSSGTSTILRVFQSGGMVCHLVNHKIIAGGRPPAHDYRFTWCRTPTGEWKIKS